MLLVRYTQHWCTLIALAGLQLKFFVISRKFVEFSVLQRNLAKLYIS